MFDIVFWNMCDRTTQSSMRTNNSAEAYHRRIGSVFQCAHRSSIQAYHRRIGSVFQCAYRSPIQAYHRRIGSVFQCPHPILWIFLEKLVDEESNTHANILQIIAGQPPKHKKKNQHFEMRLLNLISTPHSNPNT